MFKNQAACENHMKSVHNITNKELKMAQFMPLSGELSFDIFIFPPFQTDLMMYRM